MDKEASKAISRLNIKNILELSTQDREIVDEIKKFLNEQVSELNTGIDAMQDAILKQA